MSKNIDMSNYKIVNENDKFNFISITLEEKTKLLNDGYRKISDENFSLVYQIEDVLIFNLKNNLTLDTVKQVVFDVQMPKSYIHQPFFNVGVEYARNFGVHRSELNVLFDEDKKNKVGWVDRKNQGNGVRIHIHKKYVEWAKLNFKPGDLMKVEVLPNTTIRLSKKTIHLNL
jgi:hypothetical protein